MGKRGPKPDPKSRRSREGRNTFKPQLVDAEFMRRAAAGIKKTKSEKLKPPTGLGKAGLEFWRKYAPYCEANGTLHRETAPQFAELARAYFMLDRSIKEMDGQPTMNTTDSGYQQVSPYITEYRKALALWLRLCDRFGLKPHPLAPDGDDGGRPDASDLD